MHSFFKRNKIAETPLFSNKYVDIHSHLLPGIDDGSKNLDETVALIKKMQGLGIQHFILTPHVMEGVWENSSEDIVKKLKELKAHLKSSGIGVGKMEVAAEYMLDNNFATLLQTEKLRCLKDNKVLVEMSYSNPPINLYDLLFDIQVAGYQPILAHPERYGVYHNNFDEYYKLKEAGCLFQMNLLSLSTYYGKGVQKTAKKLIKNELIDFVGTDTHHQRHLNALAAINTPANAKLLRPLLENNETFL